MPTDRSAVEPWRYHGLRLFLRTHRELHGERLRSGRVACAAVALPQQAEDAEIIAVRELIAKIAGHKSPAAPHSEHTPGLITRPQYYEG